MAYEHNKHLVSKIDAYTQKFINDRANINPDDATNFPIVMVDGLPLNPQCADLLTNLRLTMPNLKIGISRGGDVDYHNRIQSVCVYRENDTYAIGRIGFRDVAVSSTKMPSRTATCCTRAASVISARNGATVPERRPTSRPSVNSWKKTDRCGPNSAQDADLGGR